MLTYVKINNFKPSFYQASKFVIVTKNSINVICNLIENMRACIVFPPHATDTSIDTSIDLKLYGCFQYQFAINGFHFTSYEIRNCVYTDTKPTLAFCLL